MGTILIKTAVSAALSYFSGSALAKMVWAGDSDIAGSFLAITYILVFLWGYFALSATAWALHLGGFLALVAGFFSLAIGGAIAIGDAFLFAGLHYGRTFEEMGATANEFWIVMLISVVLYLVFPMIDIILMIKTIRDRG